MEPGQRLHYEFLCRDLSKVKPVLVLVGHHDTLPSEDVDSANVLVSEFRIGGLRLRQANGEWHEPKEAVTFRSFIDWFRKKCGFPEIPPENAKLENKHQPEIATPPQVRLFDAQGRPYVTSPLEQQPF